MRETIGRLGRFPRPATGLIVACIAFHFLLLFGAGRTATAFELTEADCRCCHTSGLPDRHHLLVQTQNAVCLDCHGMVLNEETGVFEAAVVRDCLACHTASLADRHHLAAQGSSSECLSCHAVLFDPGTGSYFVDFRSGCGTAAPAEACTDGPDNDGDGLADCADPDCASTAACLPARGEVCTDGTDNDGDTLADCADPDCGGTDACRPGQTGHYAVHATASSDCTGCHLSNLVDEHRERCASCHQGTASAITSAVGAGRTDCTACHSATVHRMGCRNCHTVVPAKVRKEETHRRHLPRVACGVCHKVPETIRLDPSGASCRTCHGVSRPWTRSSLPTLHLTHAKGRRFLPYSCAMCHGQAIPQTRPDQCGLCHTGKIFQRSDLQSVHRTHNTLFDCTNCHFNPRDFALDPPGKACLRCHDSRPYTSVFTLHQKHRGKQCWSCHTGDGVTARSNHGCASCHGSTPVYTTADDLHRRHSGIGNPCWACHAEVVPVFPTVRQTLSAPLGAMTGVVTSGGIPLEGVTVKTLDGRYSTLTGTDGLYRLDYIVPGVYTLLTEKSGYLPQSQSVTVLERETAMVGFTLTPVIPAPPPPSTPGGKKRR